MRLGWPAVRPAAKGLVWCLIFGVELAASVVVFVIGWTLVATHWEAALPREIRIAGDPAVRPQLEFACELATPQLQSLLSQHDVIDDLRELRAGISLSLVDLSPGRAEIVRLLNRAGIPVTAWIALPEEQGYYVNAANAPQAAARFAAFKTWTREFGLRWARVGLDVEPNIQEFVAMSRGNWSRLIVTVVRRCLDSGSVSRARKAYAGLIRQIQAAGYPVETYQFPFLADERKVHSTLLERVFGIVDVRGDREVLMTYSSFNHAADSALVWQYGPDAQLLVVGSTAGDPKLGANLGPLSWEELSRDMLVASHFSPLIGVYSLEGCVRQGFLPRLKAMNWDQSVTISREADSKIIQLRTRIQAVLWTGSHLPYFAAAILLMDVCLIWRQRTRHRASARTTAAKALSAV